MNFGCFSNKGKIPLCDSDPAPLAFLILIYVEKIFVSKFPLNMLAESVPSAFHVRQDLTRNAAVLSSHWSYSKNFFIIYINYLTFSSLCGFFQGSALHFPLSTNASKLRTFELSEFFSWKGELLSKVTFDNNCGTEILLLSILQTPPLLTSGSKQTWLPSAAREGI